MEETIIISLGGSLIVPEEIDAEFLKEFRNLILSYVAKGKRFVIDTGGGKTCRKYQSVAREIVDASKEDLDWIGLTVNNVNAQLVRVIFGKDACKKVLDKVWDSKKVFDFAGRLSPKLDVTDAGVSFGLDSSKKEYKKTLNVAFEFLNEVVKRTHGKVIVLFDEFQVVKDVKNGDAILKYMREKIQKMTN